MSVDLLKAAYLTRLAKLPHGEKALNYTQEDKKKKKCIYGPLQYFSSILSVPHHSKTFFSDCKHSFLVVSQNKNLHKFHCHFWEHQ